MNRRWEDPADPADGPLRTSARPRPERCRSPEPTVWGRFGHAPEETRETCSPARSGPPAPPTVRALDRDRVLES
ncbi:hypothetical protein [Pseudonocardia parietis]|uniref:Uncharacterized protein n=1 Tax=Pseudonocardia parietis TaxID=570936 RepID=A0ABS4VQH0_9PSEU|nr:hypothetical protein [Pseudonocardia parietis]MBP2366169.1 hypothetical protein [Pseudonocardia parietis]